jgi:hypothetical protein
VRRIQSLALGCMYPAFVSYCLGFKVVCGRANRLEGLLLRTETVMPVLGQTRSWLAARRDRNMKGNHPLCREHRVSTFLTIEKTTPPSCQPSITHVIVTFAPRLMEFTSHGYREPHCSNITHSWGMRSILSRFQQR